MQQIHHNIPYRNIQIENSGVDVNSEQYYK